MLSNIAFEQIDGNYWYGAYGEFKVVMMKDNGFINVTKMCKFGGKDYKEWARYKKGQSLIQSLQTYLTQKAISDNQDLSLRDSDGGIHTSLSSPCISIMTNNATDVECLISGTYAHPTLIAHIASWISNDFAIKVGEIVTGHIILEYKSKLSTMQQQLEVKEEAKEKAMQETQELEKIVKIKKLQLDTWGNSHAFTMVRLNNLNGSYPYYAIRCKRLNMSSTVKKLRRRNPNSILMCQTQSTCSFDLRLADFYNLNGIIANR